MLHLGKVPWWAKLAAKLGGKNHIDYGHESKTSLIKINWEFASERKKIRE